MTSPLRGEQVPAFTIALGRRMRAAGYAVGPSRIVTAVEAAAAVPLRKDDLRAALQAAMVDRPEQRAPFRALFEALWLEPPAAARSVVWGDDEAGSGRADGLGDLAGFGSGKPRPSSEQEELDALLARLEFSTMGQVELEAVKAAIRELDLPGLTMKTRRFAPNARGQRIDLRATLRDQFRSGHGFVLQRKRLRQRPVPITVICDISESMTSHSRLLLHFMHRVAQEPGAYGRVSAFVFGTQLTPVTRQLRERDTA
ncbi:MAG: VWA domain-containing protein, partial [Spongiibacteraceae bacterium]